MMMLQTRPERVYLLDLDGTLICDRKPLPGAKALLAKLERFALVSNDSEHTPSQLSRMLSRIGLAVDDGRIVLAGTHALEMVARERRKARVMLLGSAAISRYGRHLGLEMAWRDPDIVLIARDRTFNFDKLAAAANAVREGAELIVANPDVAHPGHAGTIVPETGALLAAILACTGSVPHRIVGKPEPDLFEQALTILGADPSQAVMIGDNPYTDGAGARRLGIRYIPITPSGPLASLDSLHVL